MKINRYFEATGILVGCIVLTKITSFFASILMSYRFGAGAISDAYVIASSIPTVIFGGFISAIITGYIPLYNQIKTCDNKNLGVFNRTISIIVCLLGVMICIFVLLFTEQIVSLFASGFIAETYRLTVAMTKISAISVIFIACASIPNGYLQAIGKFNISGLTTIPANLFACLAILFVTKHNAEFLTVGILMGYVIMLPIMGIFALRNGFYIRGNINFKSNYIVKFRNNILPIFIGVVVIDVNSMIDKTLASHLETGTISCLDYAYKISAMIHGFLATPLSTVTLSDFSGSLADNIDGVYDKVLVSKAQKILTSMLLLAIPITVGIILLSDKIVTILYYRGEFSYKSVLKTSIALSIYSIGAIPRCCNLIQEKMFYAKQLSKYPMICSIVSVGINVVSSFILMQFWGYIGLAIGTSLSAISSFFIMLFFLKKHIRSFTLKNMNGELKKILFASAIMCAAILIIKRIFGIFCTDTLLTAMIITIITTIFAAIVYFEILLIIKSENAIAIKHGIIKAINQRKEMKRL